MGHTCWQGPTRIRWSRCTISGEGLVTLCGNFLILPSHHVWRCHCEMSWDVANSLKISNFTVVGKRRMRRIRSYSTPSFYFLLYLMTQCGVIHFTPQCHVEWMAFALPTNSGTLLIKGWDPGRLSSHGQTLNHSGARIHRKEKKKLITKTEVSYARAFDLFFLFVFSSGFWSALRVRAIRYTISYKPLIWL